MYSKRVQSINTSGIRKAFKSAADLVNPINLSIGQPFYDALPECRAAAKAAIDSGKSGYGQNLGLIELRDRLKQHLGFNSNSTDFDLAITAGVSGGFTLAYCALLDPGDQIAIPDPFFGIYRDVAQLLNAEPVFYDLYPDFHPTAEKIERALTKKTKVVVVNSPANPTGIALEQSELDQVIDLCRSRNLWLIYDEIYSELVYDRPHASALFRYEKSLTLNGFAKSMGIPGWRIGYVVGPREAIDQMIKVQQYTFVCAPTVLQWGALAGVGLDLTDYREEYRRKGDFLYQALKQKYELTKPEGAFFLFPKAPRGSGQEIFDACLKQNLIVVPGNAFSSRDTHFRISYSASQDQLEQGAEILLRL